MGWIWPLLALTIVVVIVLASLRVSSRRTEDLPEWKGEGGGPTRMNIFGSVLHTRRPPGSGRRGL
jgi:hypothetical protein